MSCTPVLDKTDKRLLHIGYIWQYKTADLATLSATALHVRAVVAEFNKHGHQVRMITYYRGQPHWSDDLVNWHPINVARRPYFMRILEKVLRGIQSRLHLPYLNLFDSYGFADACTIAAAECDILYERFWMLASGGAITAKKLGIPIIYEVNGDLVEEYHLLGIKLSKLQWAAIHYITRRMFENAGQVITVSEMLKQRTIQRWRLRTTNVRAIENGADVDLIVNPSEDEVKAIRSQYQLNGNKVVIFVGTFKPWHGIDLLVDAFGQIAASNSTAKLILVGDGPLRSELEARVAELHLNDQVIFTGLVSHDDVPALLHVADIAVLNPKVSGASNAQSPLKLFEYMAAGNAVVAPEIPNVKKILTNRQNSLLVPPDNREALTRALTELLDNSQLRMTLGQAAQQQAIEKHSWHRTVDEIESIMYGLVN